MITGHLGLGSNPPKWIGPGKGSHTIIALIYIANYTRPDIAFSINLLVRYTSVPTQRHWNGIMHILRYLQGTTDMGLSYSKELKQHILGYANAGYLLDPHKARLQIGYVFNYNETAISCRSFK